MEILELAREDLSLIKPLWERLNRLHREKSVHFADHFDRFTFDARSRELVLKSRLGIFAARHGKGEPYEAYCIVSLEGGTGEIDSLYVSPDCRGTGTGSRLMERGLEWLAGSGCEKIRISVAHGNEQALGFYEKFGFKKRFTVLEQIRP